MNSDKKLRGCLMIDGAYLMMGNKDMIRKGSQSLDISYQGLLNFREVIQTTTKCEFDKMFFYTAEYDRNKPFQGSAFYKSMRRAQFQIDIREFKYKDVFCKNPNCEYSKHPVTLSTQAEVDVAIATKIIDLAYRNEFDVLVLIAGDRDFRDAVELLSQSLKKKVWVIGYSHNTATELIEKSSIGCVAYLDYIWDQIAEIQKIPYNQYDTKIQSIQNHNPIIIPSQPNNVQKEDLRRKENAQTPVPKGKKHKSKKRKLREEKNDNRDDLSKRLASLSLSSSSSDDEARNKKELKKEKKNRNEDKDEKRHRHEDKEDRNHRHERKGDKRNKSEAKEENSKADNKKMQGRKEENIKVPHSKKYEKNDEVEKGKNRALITRNEKNKKPNAPPKKASHSERKNQESDSSDVSSLDTSSTSSDSSEEERKMSERKRAERERRAQLASEIKKLKLLGFQEADAEEALIKSDYNLELATGLLTNAKKHKNKL